MFPTISIGSAVIATAPLIYIIGAYVSLDVVERAARSLRQDGVRWYAIAGSVFLAGVLAARLAFVAQNIAIFMEQPLSIVWPLTAGYVPWIGVVLGLMVLFYQCGRNRFSLWQAADVLAPALVVALGFVALADVIGGSGLGTPTSVLWGVERIDVVRHPVQVYELLVSGVALLVWWRMRTSVEAGFSFGRIGVTTIAIYAFGRLLTDAYRANTPLVGAGFHLIQLIALLVLLGSILLLARLHSDA